MKVFDEAMGLVRRFAPALVAHLLLLVWLAWFVLDPRALANGASLWAQLSGNIDAVLKAVGLSVERWYVIAAFLLAYLTAFEWLRRAVAELPGFRIVYDNLYAPDVLERACTVLKLEPDYWRVSRALDFAIDRAVERVRQTNQTHPYQWLIDRWLLLQNYHGTMMVGVIAMVAWAAAGAPYALSGGRVWLTALLLAAIGLGLRWAARRQERKRRDRTAYWALSELEGADAALANDPLRHERSRAMGRIVAEELAMRRHPSWILERLAGRLPKRLAEKARRRIAWPRRPPEQAWKLAASRRTRFADEGAAPPAALDARPFAARFAPLLEGEGAGLCILAPRLAGLAPGLPHGGEHFSFAERKHDGDGFGLVLDPLPAGLRLRVTTGASPGFIARVGTWPLANLLVGVWPPGAARWHRLVHDPQQDRFLLAPDAGAAIEVDGIEIGRDAPLDPGASYLLGIAAPGGVRARLACQCFAVAGEPRLLVAWAFLDVQTPGEEADPDVPPWWKPAAWKGLIKPREVEGAG